MLKANELRIGNKIAGADITCVYDVDASMIKDIERGTNLFIPIPLTEEWLIKCGCEKTNTSWTFNKSGNIYYEFSVQGFYAGDHGIYICDSDDGWYLYIHVSRNDEGTNDEAITNYFHSLHEFQNKIYALTSEELTIK